jgi:hypothetical protein
MLRHHHRIILVPEGYRCRMEDILLFGYLEHADPKPLLLRVIT